MCSTRAAAASPQACRPRAAVHRQEGFTIIEVLVAILLLTIGILGALVMIDSANGTTAANSVRTGGVNLAREVADGSRAVQETVPFAQLTDGCPTPSSPANPCPATAPVVAALQGQPGIAPDADAPAGQWTITRDGYAYGVKVAVCGMDDPSDGLGDHSSGGPFCADGPAGGSADNAPKDYQRLTVDVSWSGSRGNEDTRSVALLQSDGVNAPAVSCLRPTSSPCPITATPMITDPATTSLPFAMNVAGPVSRIVWYVDGAFKGTVTPSGNTAAFTWSLGTVGSGSEVFDGTYQLSATAFDVNGKSGTTGSVQVQVNRRKPAAPGGFVAGRDTLIGGNGAIGGVDVSWLPVPDKDVLYYRVYRRVGTGSALMLTQTSGSGVTSYVDRTPPSNPSSWSAPCANPRQAATSTLTYYVVAVDQSGAAPRDGTQPTAKDVNACNTPPKNPPANILSLANNANGTVTLSGSLPSAPTDPDAGDSVGSVRIYRWSGSSTPSDPADRLELVPVTGSSFTFTDPAPRPGGVTQKYCFTNLDTRMQESSCSNVVSG